MMAMLVGAIASLSPSVRSRYRFTLLLASVSFAFAALTPQSQLDSQLSPRFPRLGARGGLSSRTLSGSLDTVALAEKYRNPPQPPPLFTGTEQTVMEDVQKLIDGYRELLKRLATINSNDSKQATFDAAILPQLQYENEAGCENRILTFYQHVSTDSPERGALRNASQMAQELMNNADIEVETRDEIFRIIHAVYVNSGLKDAKGATHADKAKEIGLDVESVRALWYIHKDHIENGLGLPVGPQRERFREIKLRLNQLSTMFSKNLKEGYEGVWFTPAELDGVPKGLIDSLGKGTGENEGKLDAAFQPWNLFSVLKYAKDEEARKRLFIASQNWANKNAKILREVAVLRDESARMLGYPNHAALRLEDRMARDPQTVLDFLGDLRTRLAPGGAQEIDHLLQMKKNDTTERGTPYDGNFYLWDHRFYDRLMIEREGGIDEQEVSEYFPLKSTISRMLGIFGQLFGLVFVELGPDERARLSPTGKAEDIVWHEDVILFSVWDDEGEGGGFVGYLYFDLHPRAGKFSQMATFNLQPGFLQADGESRRYPATALVCNLSKPTPTQPSLLKHTEVVTLLHELGHGIHDLTGRTRFSRFHGILTVKDFVEVPSQMLENWFWAPGPLVALSEHFETKKQIPADLVDKIISTKHINSALASLRQLYYSLYDMKIHTPETHQEVESFDLGELFNKMRAEISGLKGLEALGEGNKWGNGQATFSHLMGGYDSGYYSYLYSKVYSSDVFYSVFRDNPMDGVKGRRYRHTILERGGSRDEILNLEEFLGRKPSSEAFYRELGLTK